MALVAVLGEYRPDLRLEKRDLLGRGRRYGPGRAKQAHRKNDGQTPDRNCRAVVHRGPLQGWSEPATPVTSILYRNSVRCILSELWEKGASHQIWAIYSLPLFRTLSSFS
jgi:hypothetical protein